jgi:hypothetical protein
MDEEKSIPKGTIMMEQGEIVAQLPLEGRNPELPDFIKYMLSKAQAENAIVQMVWQDGKTIKVAPDSDPAQVYQEWAKEKSE